MIFYDENGNVITLEIADNSEELEALGTQIKELEELNNCQADILLEVQKENALLTEINQNVAYIFVLVLAFLLYRIISGALSSMFGGG